MNGLKLFSFLRVTKMEIKARTKSTEQTKAGRSDGGPFLYQLLIFVKLLLRHLYSYRDACTAPFNANYSMSKIYLIDIRPEFTSDIYFI